MSAWLNIFSLTLWQMSFCRSKNTIKLYYFKIFLNLSEIKEENTFNSCSRPKNVNSFIFDFHVSFKLWFIGEGKKFKNV